MIRNLLIILFFISTNYSIYSQIAVADGTPYTQDFNSLISAGTSQVWTNNSTLQGWYLYNKSNNAIVAYNADAGSGTTGSFISYGTALNSERSLGGLASGGAYFGSPPAGTVAGWIAVCFNNTTGSTINDAAIAFNGEQWRNNGNVTAQSMVLQYGLGATFTSVSTWVTPGGNFDWTSPIATATAAAVDGNVAGLVSGRGGNLTSLNWVNGAILWIRWIENNDVGNDHGLTIDNFSFTPTVIGGCAQPSTQAMSFSATNLMQTSMDVSYTRGNGDKVLVIARSSSAVDASPLSGSSYSANSIFGSGDEIGIGNFVVYNGILNSVSVSNLNPSTTYHYAIYEYNSIDNCYKASPLLGNATTTSAPVAYYRSIASGDWNTPANWESSSDNMNWINAISAPTFLDNSINVRTGNKLDITSTLSLDNLTIDAGGTIEVIGGTLTLNEGTGTDLDILGTLINSNTTPIVISSGATIVVENGGTYQHNVINPNIPLCTWNTGSNCEILKFPPSSLNNTLSQAFYNFYWNNTIQTGETNLAGYLNTINGDFKLLSTNSFNLRQIGSAMTLAVGGNFELCATCKYSFSGASGQGTIDLKGNLVLNGKLTETSGGSGRLVFSKTTGPQAITYGSSASIDETVNMEINNVNGIDLLSDAFITGLGTLTFVNGQVRTNGFTFYISSSVTVAGNNSSRYFCTCDNTGLIPATTGGLIMDVNTGTSILHPVGPTSSLYMPATLIASPTSTFGNYIVRVQPLGSNGVVPVDATKCIQYQWEIEDLDPSTQKDLKLQLQWVVGTEGVNFTPGPSLVIGHWNGTKFNIVNPATYNSGDPSALSTIAFDSFSPFVVASENIALPVTLTQFNVLKYNNGAMLNWATTADYNHNRFEIEKSKDGKSFDYLGAVANNNTSSNIKKYSYYDLSPLQGLTYYRLKSIDNNGSYTYSETRTIQFNVKGDLTLVNVNNEVVIRGVESVATMIVYDFNGKIVYQKNVNNGYSISLNELPKGALYFTVNESDKANTLKVINL